MTCIWNTKREWSCRSAVHSISEQNNLMVYSQADARPCLLCTQKFKIQLESPLNAKGIAFPLKAEWHWFYVFLRPLLYSLQGHRALHQCYKWIKKSFCEHFPHISMSHYVVSYWNWFLISIVQLGRIFTDWILKPFLSPVSLICDINFCYDILWSCSLSNLLADCWHRDCHRDICECYLLVLLAVCVHI